MDEAKEEAEKGDEEKENDVVTLMRRAHRLRSEIDSSLMRSAEVSVDLKKKTCTDEALGSLLERRLQQSRDNILHYNQSNSFTFVISAFEISFRFFVLFIF